MKSYNFTDLAIAPMCSLKCDKYPKVTVPDLNIDLYEMLVRHQNGDISTLGGSIRRDALYDSDDDVQAMRVNLANDPDFNIANAKFYIKAMKDAAERQARLDIEEYQLTHPEQQTDSEN